MSEPDLTSVRALDEALDKFGAPFPDPPTFEQYVELYEFAGRLMRNVRAYAMLSDHYKHSVEMALVTARQTVARLGDRE